jgi:cell division protein FtsL
VISVRVRRDRKQKVVRARDTRWVRDLVVTLGTVSVLSAPFAVYILKCAENRDYGFQIEEYRQHKEDLLEENRALKLDRARLMSPDRVEKIAHEELELEPAPTDDFFLVEKVPDEGEEDSVQMAMYRSLSMRESEGREETPSP